MCGITGIIRTNKPASKHEIKQMTNAIAHRGPDGDGYWLKEHIAIGHRRLSIIDLTTGQQPMSNENEKIWITFNGELYNFPELKTELEAFGHLFKTKSDTEIVIHAYEQWGKDCVNRFRGMFAFGIVDIINSYIFLARDHFGIKPLIYYQDKNCFAFASEMLALRQIEDAEFEISLQGLDEYLWLQYIPAPNSIFKNVKKLLPAHRMIVDFNGNILLNERYWQLQFKPKYFKTEKDWIKELDFILFDSVKKHLISDVPFGAYLSGGVDSSAVVTYMAQILEHPVKTFSIGFDDGDFDETKYAKIVADKCNTEHHVEYVKPDAIKILPELVSHYGEPYGDSSAMPTYYVSKLARKHVTMVLSGDGGDEFFGGYESYFWWLQILDTPLARRPKWKDFLYPYVHKYFPKRYPKPHKPIATLTMWLSIINYLNNQSRKELWRKEYHSNINYKQNYFEDLFEESQKFSNANKAQYFDINTYLPFDILTKVDIASMIHSLEVRTPLVDVKVAEFAATIPEKLNIRKFDNQERKGKLLLRKLLSKHYSNDFLFRRKMGFSIPYNKWLKLDGEYSNEISERLFNRNSILNTYFLPEAIKNIVDKKQYGPIWLLLFLDEWFKQNK